MKSGTSQEHVQVWTLPPGFRIYGFHGLFDRRILFLGPVFKAMELKQWDQRLYTELPKPFKICFQVMVLVKNRHKQQSPDDGAMYSVHARLPLLKLVL